MKISVIIPVYNAEKFLRSCLDSVLNQTMDDYEVILINDGSTDSSPEIIGEYQEKYPEKIRSLTVDNGGQGRAKNFGIDMSCGEYITNVDSDDRIAPDMLEKMYSAAVENDADVVVCDFFRVIDGKEFYEEAKLTENPLSAVGQCWNKLFRRSLVGDIRYPVGLWYEDSEFSGKLMISSRKTVFVHEALYYYNIGHP
ncbi:MAG: glycosyltransferase, partial [Eubacteriales bacterium]|nr:glycosyltransferase [Eubacteriales bacterium]